MDILNSFFNLFEDFTNTLFFKLLFNIFSSFTFVLILLYWMRPKVKISPYICFQKLPQKSNIPNSPKSYFYVFKITNNSLFPVFDLEIKLLKLEHHVVNDGEKINKRTIPLKTNVISLDYLPRKKRKTGYGDNAYQLRSDEEITNLVKDQNTTVQLSVKSKHGLSNLSRVVTQKFYREKMIYKDCEFKFGTSLDIHE